jgi:hypothetical protein
MKRYLFLLIMVGALATGVLGVETGWVLAKDTSEGELPPSEVEVVNPYYTIERFTLDDGTMLEKNIINGPPEPLPEYEDARTASIQPLPSRGVISNFPSYDWVFGCSAVSGAMIAAYYDNNGYPDMYNGPTNGGVMPLTDTSWATWFDGNDTYPNNPLIASHQWVDGRTIRGSIDDYWVGYNSAASDPYITGAWTQHTWSDAIGDFMKTSQSAYGNVDGSTAFYNWTTSGDPLTCSDMVSSSIDDIDGTFGRKLFYEARGYSVADCYNQKTDNNGGGFTLSDFQAEINLGHPVLLNLAGHSIVGYGYSGSTIYIRDTWDNNPSNVYTMTWGGSYDGMVLQSVSVVRLDPLTTPPPPAPTGVSASDGTYTDRVRISWSPSAGADDYQVYRNTVNSTGGATGLVSGYSSSTFDDFSATPGVTYYYWVKACNEEGCSGFSSSDTGYAAISAPSAPSNIIASDGTFSDKVRVTWGTPLSDFVVYLPLILKGGTAPAPFSIYYQVYRNTTNSTAGAAMLVDHHPGSPYNDTGAVPGTLYYYWVKACISGVCSGFSQSDSGYRSGEITVPTAPDQVDASNGNYSDRVNLTWAASAGATYYKVYRHTLDNSSSATPLSENHSSSPYDDYSAVTGTTYYYWVKACNSAGCSGFSLSDTGWLNTNSLVNGDFEQGHVAWTEYSTHGWDIIMEAASSPAPAHGGSWLAWLGGDYEDTSSVSQSITIPTGMPYLHYWYWIGSEDACSYDYFWIKFGSTTVHTKDLCASQDTGGWVEGVLNMSMNAGSTNTLIFEVSTDSSLNSNVFLDDIFFSGSASAYAGVITPEGVNQDLLNRVR